MTNFRDILKVQGVKAKGYGIVPKMVMLDRKLTIESKAIYSYFCSYAGAGDTAFPGRDKICDDLVISKTRYYNHIKLLQDYGYITIDQVKQKGKFNHNVYTLVDKPEEVKEDNKPCPQNNDTVESEENTGIPPCPRDGDTGNGDTGNEDTTINKSLYNQQSSLLLSINHSQDIKENERVKENTTPNEFNDILKQSGYDDIEKEYIPAVEQAIRILYYTDKPLAINGTRVPPHQVREDLKRLRWKHIDLALRDFKIASEREPIRNVSAYLSVCIYNSIFNSDLKLDAEINYNGY